MKKSYLALALLLSACATSGNEGIKNNDLVSKIHKGSTTSAEVQTLFGEPQEKITDDAGLEKWKYSYVHAYVTGPTYIPVVGLFAGGSKANINTLEIGFDKNHVVKTLATGTGNAESHNFGHTDRHIDTKQQ